MINHFFQRLLVESMYIGWKTKLTKNDSSNFMLLRSRNSFYDNNKNYPAVPSYPFTVTSFKVIIECSGKYNISIYYYLISHK